MASNLTSKLELQPGQALFVLNASDEIESYLMAQMPKISLISAPYDITQAALIFVKTMAEAKRFLPLVTSVLDAEGILWLAYPKSGSTINTDLTQKVLKTAFQSDGLVFVRQISLHENWAAIRFRFPVTAKQDLSTGC
jgi:hypothetical protein